MIHSDCLPLKNADFIAPLVKEICSSTKSPKEPTDRSAVEETAVKKNKKNYSWQNKVRNTAVHKMATIISSLLVFLFSTNAAFIE